MAYNKSGSVELFKPLIPTLKHKEILEHNGFTLELWDGELYETKNQLPKWKWHLTFKGNHPASHVL